MRVLVLGGTKFLGRYIVDSALKHGHKVTVFNRGLSNKEVKSGVEYLIGDRKDNLEALKGRTWDAAIDTCAYLPWHVQKSVELLPDSVEHYTLISTMSVYSNLEKEITDENTAVEIMTEEQIEEVKNDATGEAMGKYYGGLKYLCELEAEKAMPGRVMIVRPGLIVGAFDPSDRFTYWVRRVSQGGEILCPGRQDAKVQFIDAADLAEWIVKLSEDKAIGILNATGPKNVITMGEFLESCKRVSKSDAEFTWVDEEFLFENNVKFWSDMPVWIPDRINSPGFFGVDITRALQKSLDFRPLEETLEATLSWDNTRIKETKLKAGIMLEKEKELLKLWHNKN